MFIRSRWIARGSSVALLAASMLAGRAARAQPHVALPPVLLGQSSFLDGFGAPGFAAGDVLVLAHATSYAGPGGVRAPGENELTLAVTIPSVGYVAPWSVLGGHIGTRALIPIAYATMTAGGETTHASGLADVFFAPLLYLFPPIETRGLLIRQRILLDLILPVGSYDRTARLNTGSNLFAVDPAYAITVLSGPVEASVRLNYLWCGENGEPPPRFRAASVQPGDAIHANFAASYEIARGVRSGVAGYFLKQVSDQRVGGVSVPGSREQTFALGPGLGFFGQHVRILANALWELAVENRYAGARSNIVFTYVWR